MDLLGGYSSDEDDDVHAPSPAVTTSTVASLAPAASIAAAPAMPTAAASSSTGGLNLAALLPAAATSGSTNIDDAEARAARKRHKQEKKDRKEAKRQKRESQAQATNDTPVPVESAPIMPAPVAGKFGLSAMLPPPKFTTDPAPTKPTVREVPPSFSPPAPAGSASTAAAATTTAAAPLRAPPGMRPPPGMRAPNPPPAAASAIAAADSSAAASPAAAAAAPSYEDAMSAARAFAGVSTDDAAQDAVNAELARNPHLLADDDNEPYVPLYARAQAQVPRGVKADNFSEQLGDLTGQDKYFKRVLGTDINFLTVSQTDLTHQTLSEQLLAQFEEKNPPANSAAVKVSAQFWNSKTGAMETTNEVSAIAKRKHQINTLASSAAAMEVELARQRQAGYAKRDSARKKYGW